MNVLNSDDRKVAKFLVKNKGHRFTAGCVRDAVELKGDVVLQSLFKITEKYKAFTCEMEAMRNGYVPLFSYRGTTSSYMKTRVTGSLPK